MPVISVAIVEDNDQIRDAFARIIEQAEGFRFLSEYRTAEEALAGIPGEAPDVVLMDINLPGMSGIECVRKLKAVQPAVQILMLTVFEDSDAVFDSLKAGASGYLVKRTSRADLLEAIEQVYSGGAPMSPHIARMVVRYFNQAPRPALGGPVPDAEQLTDREREVLDCLAKGYYYKEIADALSISINTVRKHLKSVYEKLHVHSRTEAILKYVTVPRP